MTYTSTEAERFWALSEAYRLLHVATTDAAVAVDQHEQLIDALAGQDRGLTLRVLAAHRQNSSAAALTALGATDPVRRLATG